MLAAGIALVAGAHGAAGAGGGDSGAGGDGDGDAGGDCGGDGGDGGDGAGGRWDGAPGDSLASADPRAPAWIARVSASAVAAANPSLTTRACPRPEASTAVSRIAEHCSACAVSDMAEAQEYRLTVMRPRRFRLASARACR